MRVNLQPSLTNYQLLTYTLHYILYTNTKIYPLQECYSYITVMLQEIEQLFGTLFYLYNRKKDDKQGKTFFCI
jgi:hypothetical protein